MAGSPGKRLPSRRIAHHSHLPLQLDDLLVKGMGTDFLFILLQPGTHASSVVLTLRCITRLLRDPTSHYATRFKSANGYVALAGMLAFHAALDDVYIQILALMFGKSVDKACRCAA